jgi:hypothetical protein
MTAKVKALEVNKWILESKPVSFLKDPQAAAKAISIIKERKDQGSIKPSD